MFSYDDVWPNQGAAPNRRPAGQSDGSDNLSAIVAADRASPAAVAELVRWHERTSPMGSWGIKPYENDSAADWFGDLWEEFPLPSKVEETLKLDVDDSHEEIRAAAHVVLQLGDTYIWPADSIDRH
jgi:hypothetical protein